MRHLKKTFTGLRLQTPQAPAATPSGQSVAPATFSGKQGRVLALPLVSDDQKLIWVESSQMDLQLYQAEELDRAFDRSPYLTLNQTKTLAQRCSLLPDQVKVWFMMQRLRYGISWDTWDIKRVSVKLNWGKEEANGGMRDGGEKCRRKVRRQHGGREERMMGKREPPEKNMMREQLMGKDNEGKGKVVKKETQVEQKRMRTTSNMRNKKSKTSHAEEGAGEEQITVDVQKNWQETPYKNPESPSYMIFNVPVITDHQEELGKPFNITERENHAESAIPEDTVTDVAQLKDLIYKSRDPAHVGDVLEPTQSHSKRYLTRRQLMMIKFAFLHCQYPTAEEYTKLEKLTDVPRELLVQWFSDTRYHIKKTKKPRWMNQEQHRLALENIHHRQCVRKVAKDLPVKEGEDASWLVKLSKCKEETATAPKLG